MGKAGLSDMHKKALSLIEEGIFSRNDIAKQCGFSAATLSNLCAGNVKAAGNVALDFKTEYQKIVSKQAEDSAKLLKENKALALEKLNQRLRVLMTHNPTKEMTVELTQILNALSKTEGGISVEGGIHTHYHLTKQERADEFRRLLAATAKDVRSRISGSAGRGAAAAVKPAGARGIRPQAE